MKFSTAMMLGMAAMPSAAGDLFNDGAVCALGAGYRSLGWLDLGGEWVNPGAVLDGYEGEIVRWLKSEAHNSPCDCKDDSDRLLSVHNARGIIAHIFNRHVMGDKTWTPEKLVDYVRSIEPAENAPSEQEKAEQLRLESIDAEREGTEIYTSGYPIL